MIQLRALIRVTVQEYIRSKTMLALLLIGCFFVLIFSCCGLSESMSVNNQIVAKESQIDLFWGVAYWILALYGVAGSVLLSMNCVSSEIRSRRAALVWTRPISRMTWLIGKIIGVWIVTAIDTGVLFLLIYFLIVAKLKIVSFFPFVGFSILLLEILAIIILVSTLSIRFSDVISGFLGSIIYGVSLVIGMDWVQAYFFQIQEYLAQTNTAPAELLRAFLQEPPSILWQIFFWITYIITPHFGNIQGIGRKLASHSPIALSLDWWSFLSVLLYSLIFLIIGRREIKRMEF
ncbi:MAG: hypothetical protein B6244_05335 [Candidatus Cloacimonetes bacterium 4572_55]|nr:MAG: hypothetical protein B6244_05335 [Candidatus Cloacimonetes bacterium 4572_55]